MTPHILDTKARLLDAVTAVTVMLAAELQHQPGNAAIPAMQMVCGLPLVIAALESQDYISVPDGNLDSWLLNKLIETHGEVVAAMECEA